MKLKTSSVHPRAAFRHGEFRLFLSARFLALCAHQMLIVAVSQSVFEITHDPLHLGYIGLTLFVPKIAFTLLAGHTADRRDRRGVILACRIVEWLVACCILVHAFFGFHPLGLLFTLLLLMGTAHAFDGPASQAIVTQVVPVEDFGNAVSWNSSSMQIAFIVGPALGGWFYALGGGPVLALAAVVLLRLASALLVSRLKRRTDHIGESEISLKTLLAGIHYVFQARIILGAISLDLFAVLLGGAVALMPIYANDILQVGPTGLGLLRAAPSAGAALMAIAIAYLPPMKRAGPTMLWAVVLFGVATVLFGISKNFAFSLVCLFILGASDMISVVIRHVLVQMKTPPEMRGRVSAVNMIFIGASNELGEFESGFVARLIGVVPSVIFGGVGTLAVVALWAWRFPEIRRYHRMEVDRTSELPA